MTDVIQMTDLIIEATTKSPEIKFLTNGELKISGTSVPEDVINYFQPMITWANEFKKTEPKNISLTLDFIYLNTSSTIFVLKLLKSLHDISDNGGSLKVIWRYDDDDMYEQGEILQTLSKCKIDFVRQRHTN